MLDQRTAIAGRGAGGQQWVGRVPGFWVCSEGQANSALDTGGGSSLTASPRGSSPRAGPGQNFPLRSREPVDWHQLSLQFCRRSRISQEPREDRGESDPGETSGQKVPISRMSQVVQDIVGICVLQREKYFVSLMDFLFYKQLMMLQGINLSNGKKHLRFAAWERQCY